MKNTEKISPSEKIIEKLKEEKILEKLYEKNIFVNETRISKIDDYVNTNI